MTRAQFDALASPSSVPCPDCGGTKTQPFPNCGCPRDPASFDMLSGLEAGAESPAGPVRHINFYHHVCAGAARG